MIRKSLFGKMFLSAMTLLFIAGSLYGQETIPPDSIQIYKDKFNSLPPVSVGLLNSVGYEMPDNPPLPIREFKPLQVPPTFKPEYYPDFYPDKSPLHKGDYNVSGIIRSFDNGAIYGLGNQENIIGIGLVNNAAVGYLHQFGDRFSMNVQLNARKTITPYLQNQSFGTSGSVSYRLNDRLTLNAFGAYSMMPAHGFKTYEFGGSLNVQISERFGTEIGVRRHYDSATGSWETIPIIIPYYKFDKFTLGADVGGLLKYLLMDKVSTRRGDYTSPTIRPSIP